MRVVSFMSVRRVNEESVCCMNAAVPVLALFIARRVAKLRANVMSVVAPWSMRSAFVFSSFISLARASEWAPPILGTIAPRGAVIVARKVIAFSSFSGGSVIGIFF